MSCPKYYGPVLTHVKHKPKDEEVKVMSAQDKAKAKVNELFKEYDIEYIDHNVKDGRVTIDLVSKEKTDED